MSLWSWLAGIHAFGWATWGLIQLWLDYWGACVFHDWVIGGDVMWGRTYCARCGEERW